MKSFGLFSTNYRLDGKLGTASWGLFCATSLMALAPTASFAQTNAQRDPQALTIIRQTISAGGGEQLLASIQDITETGKITYGANLNDLQGNAIVKAHGLHQLKIEAELSTGRRITIVNGYGGVVKGADGRSMPINGQSAMDLGSFTLPYLPLIEALQDSSTSILYVGLTIHNNASVYDIRVQRASTKLQDAHSDSGKRGSKDFYIDPQTLFVTAVSDHFYLAGARTHGLLHEDLYSDYQASDGIIIPRNVIQTIGEKVGFTLNIEQVAINTGLSDAEFIW